MPLEQGSSAEVISRNIAKLREEGKPGAQAIAIAYKEAGKSKVQDVAPSAAGVIFREKDTGHILLLRRAGGDNAGTWAYPAGHVDPGESPQQAAMREFEEETGAKLTQMPQLLGVENDFGLYTATGDLFQPVLNEESSGYVWAHPDEIAQGLPAPLHPGIQEHMTSGILEKSAAMDERVIDTNGWPEIKDNPLSRVGVFPYSGRVLPDAPDPDKVYMVYRPASELADPDTIASFRLVPWIDNHTMLGEEEAGMTPAEQKGVQGVVGEEVYFAETELFPDGALFGNLKIFSESMKNVIESGKKELSCGYRCIYEWEEGTFNGQPYQLVQRKIRGNHLASVNQGRMGPDVSVQDHLTFTVDAKDIIMAEEKTGKDQEQENETMTLEQVVAALKTIGPQVQSLMEFMTKLKPIEEAEHGENLDENNEQELEGKGKDVEPDDKDKEKEKTEGMDSAEIMRKLTKQLAERDKLYGRVSAHVGAFDHAEMSVDDVAKYGIAKLGLSAPVGAERVYLGAWLDAKATQPKGSHAQDAARGSGENEFVSRLTA